MQFIVWRKYIMSIFNIDNIIDNDNLVPSFKKFFNKFNMPSILNQANARKESGVSVLDIFVCYFLSVFNGCSMYMQMLSETFDGGFKKNTLYRFINNAKINWKKIPFLLSKSVINNEIENLTSPSNKKCYVVDDTTIEKPKGKKTELQARVFDHNTRTYKKGYKLLTLGYTDGISFFPLAYNVHSSSSEKHILCPAKKCDKRSLAFARRKNAIQSKMNMAYSLLEEAQKSGIDAEIVLQDSWFGVPSLISKIKNNLSLDVICMIKKGGTKFIYDGDELNIKEIYKIARKKPGKSKYLLSIQVKIKYNGSLLPVKIVCVRNKANTKDWIAILSTDINLSEEEIIKLYSRRWEIEDFFKVSKSYLKLVNGFKSLSFDTLYAHVAIVFARYIYLAFLKRCSEDKRTMGLLFHCVYEELKQRNLRDAINIILNSVATIVRNMFDATNEQSQKVKEELEKRIEFFSMACQKFKLLSGSAQAKTETA